VAVDDRAVVALEAALSDEDRALLDQLADGLVRRRLGAAALFVLEASQPLGFLASQLMHVVRPIVAALWTRPETWDRIAALLERRAALEVLCRRLEARL
jgi:hypothetical protein